MFVGIVLLVLVCRVNAEPESVQYRCSTSSNKSMTFKPSVDGVPGRYTAELCMLKNPNITSWRIDLSMYKPTYCTNANRLVRKPDHEHSTNTLPIVNHNNCTHVCYSMNFDLIFRGCYSIKSTLTPFRGQSSQYDAFYFLIENEFTQEYFAMNKPHVSFVNHDNEVSLYWYLGIPPTEFKVELCRLQNNTQECAHTLDVSRNCSRSQLTQLHCFLRPAHGCYSAHMTHEAPWTGGIFNNQTYLHYDFCHYPAKAPVVAAGGDSRVWWALGAALLAGGALLAAAALRSAITARNYHKRLLHAFQADRTRSEVESPAAPPEPRGPLLLLYAREGEHAQRAVDALKDLIHEHTGLEVLDLFSPAVTARAAPAPAGWLRGVLAAGARVLLLQAPAAAALYHAPLGDSLALSEPLLGRRALYRSPQFGDQLLALALRCIAEDVSQHHAYHKYYFATYAELPTELLRGVVPYRRYLLPGAAPALLRDLAGAARAPRDLQAPPRLLHYERAVADMLQHVRDNPQYLMDELIIM